MKHTTKKTLVFGAAFAVLFFTAPGVQAGGMHNIRTAKSQTKNLFNTKPERKLIAHKKRKPSKYRRSKDSTSGDISMIKVKEV